MKGASNNTKEFVKAYLQSGFAVLPLHTVIEKYKKLACSCGRADCRNIAKHPLAALAPKGLNDASRDAAVLKNWFGGFTSRNVGIATGAISGIVVIDIDVQHGGKQSWSALKAKHGEVSATLHWRTGGGGE